MGDLVSDLYVVFFIFEWEEGFVVFCCFEGVWIELYLDFL